MDELDNALVEALYGFPVRRYRDALGWGWHMVDDTAERTGKHSTRSRMFGGAWERGYDESGALVEYLGRLRPSPSRNREHCAEAEAEIERRGLQGEYVNALELELFGYTGQIGSAFLWRIATAPPDVRVRAMLRVLGVEVAAH